MATYKEENKLKIGSIDKDTAIYVLEKVAKAVEETLQDRNKAKYNDCGDLIGATTKNYLEMFATLGNKLKEILNEIKGE